MGMNSSIEWTEATWNPVTGCTKISPGCVNCYAERMSKRLKLMGQRNYANGFKLTLHEDTLTLPLRWKKPQAIFVNSMSDLFHKDVPDDFIIKVFDVMKKANWHRFQILTKRAERLEEINKKIDWPSNVWMGVSVENADYTYRIDNLRKTDAKIKFISFEPLLGPINNLCLEGIDWAIVGGESGPYSRPMDPSWVLSIRDQCVKQNVAFFFKQWGGPNKKKTGRLLEGRTWDDKPVAIS
jgi:protein gp37